MLIRSVLAIALLGIAPSIAAAQGTTFAKPVNNFSSTLSAQHVSGSGTLALQSGDGAKLGALGTSQVYRLTLFTGTPPADTIVGVIEATGLSGDTLSGVTFVEGTSDATIASGTKVQARLTARNLSDIQTAVNTLEARPLVAITGATTITATGFGKTHSCSGTSANYTVTLPTPTGHTGETLEFRMFSGLTKLVTLDAGSGKTIDGSQTRVMWANEAATLRSDGSNWYRVAGRSIPMVCQMTKAANQSGAATATPTVINLDTAAIDNSGLMADTSGHKAKIVRTGFYRLTGMSVIDTLSANASRVVGYASSDGTAFDLAESELSSVTGAYPSPVLSRVVALTAGSSVYLCLYHNSGSNEAIKGGSGAGASFLEVVELP